MFKQWFANLRNPAAALEPDDRYQKAIESLPMSYMPESPDSLKLEINRLERRVERLRGCVSSISRGMKHVNAPEFEAQLDALLKAQEAVAHQNMVASKNQAVTDILYATLINEKARTFFMVFEEAVMNPDDALKKYEQYLPPEIVEAK